MTAPPAHLPVTALLVVDVQRGFDDERHWGRRDNPRCEEHVALLLETWRAVGWPVVLVRHDSVEEGSPLRPGQPGNAFKDVVRGPADLLVTKTVNSAFLGEPDLHAWLTGAGIGAVAICGISTNHCCETTARMAGNLGLDVTFVLDATHTFDRVDLDGETVPAELLARVSAANLQGEFATVRSTREVVAALAAPRSPSPVGG